MSADNWTQCPKCYVVNREKSDTMENLANLSYGRASAEEYGDKIRQAISFREAISSDENFTHTLREDYEIGIWSGEFQVIYKGYCQTCGFKFEFKHEVKV